MAHAAAGGRVTAPAVTMDDFERQYLLCDLDAQLVLGPSDSVEPSDSQSLDAIEFYPLPDVIAALSGLPGVTHEVVKDGRHVHIWEQADRYVRIESAEWPDLAPGEAASWGGGEIKAHCTFADLVRLWNGLLRTHPAAWLHMPDCTMYLPWSFLRDVALPRLLPALRSEADAIRTRAYGELDHYRSLVRYPLNPPEDVTQVVSRMGRVTTVGPAIELPGREYLS